MRFPVSLLLLSLLVAACDPIAIPDPDLEAQPLPRIGVALDQPRFVKSDGTVFIPWGVNYTNTETHGLLEDQWALEDTWSTIEGDFEEMKGYGMNVVRIHLQLHRFMRAPDQVNRQSLNRLSRLIGIAEEQGLYLDVTGLGAYRKQDQPVWYDTLGTEDRWRTQANFWQVIAREIGDSNVVFAYNLMNEPIVATESVDEWLPGNGFGGFHFVQRIVREDTGFTPTEVMRSWIRVMTEAIRKEDTRTPITVGFLPLGGISRFAEDLDFISTHIYPNSDNLQAPIDFVKANVTNKPLLIEETAALTATVEEVQAFVEQTRGDVAGFMSHYHGKTIPEMRASGTIADALRANWLEAFIALNPELGE